MNKEFKDLFYEKLLLNELSFKEQSDFFVSMINYLSHGRTEEINGRTINYISTRLDKLLEFLYALDFSVEDIEILEDMLLIAFNDAVKQISNDKEKKMGKYGQGLSGLM